MNNISLLPHNEYVKLVDDVYNTSTYKGHMLRVHNVKMTNEYIGYYYNMKAHKVSSIISACKIRDKVNNNKKFKKRFFGLIKSYRNPHIVGKRINFNPNGIRIFIRYQYNKTYAEFRDCLLSN